MYILCIAFIPTNNYISFYVIDWDHDINHIQGGHALEDSDSDVYRTSIVDIIHIVIDVMCIIWEDYCIPSIGHQFSQ